MKQTKARKTYKKQFGQQNHFLITSLIGLDYIEKNDVACPPSFSTSWNPKDKVRSTRRSRDFQLTSFLAFSVDGIDMYISLLNRSPKYIHDDEFCESISTAGRSVYNKVKIISEYLDGDKRYLCLVLLMISLRNNLLHSMAENAVEQVHKKILIENKEWIAENFRGLDIDLLLKKVSENTPPSFKEVASLINASHLFVEDIDSSVINRIDYKFYEINLLRHLKQNNTIKLKYLRLDTNRRKTFLLNFFENAFGIPIDDIEKNIVNSLLNISPSKIKMS